MIERVPDWPERLAEYLDRRQRMAFAWGTHDCCRFACLGLVAQGCPDPMPVSARRYRSEDGAARAIARLGGTLDEAATRLSHAVGLRAVPVLMAGRGCPVLADMVLPDGSYAPALGLVGMDSRFAMFVHPTDGLLRSPATACRRAWSFD